MSGDLCRCGKCGWSGSDDERVADPVRAQELGIPDLQSPIFCPNCDASPTWFIWDSDGFDDFEG